MIWDFHTVNFEHGNQECKFLKFFSSEFVCMEEKKSKIMEIISVILCPIFYYPDHLSHFITYQYRYTSHYLKKFL